MDFIIKNGKTLFFPAHLNQAVVAQDESGWRWVKVGGGCWKWVVVGENGWSWVKVGAGEWKWVEVGLKWVEVDGGR